MKPDQSTLSSLPSIPIEWERAATHPEFKALMAAKARFLVPAVIFFIAYYFALPVLVGYFPELMKTQVLGPLNLAYLFALSQFVMVWLLTFLYMRAAAKFDVQAKKVVDHMAAESQKAKH